MPFTFPRCEVVPLPDHQAAFRIDGAGRFRWYFGPDYPGPFCLDDPVTTTKKTPLALRYLLHAHAGPVSPNRAGGVLKDFAARPRFEVVKATARYPAWDVGRNHE